jgi:hypothetical protein
MNTLFNIVLKISSEMLSSLSRERINMWENAVMVQKVGLEILTKLHIFSNPE